MKSKYLILVSVLLSQAAPVWGVANKEKADSSTSAPQRVNQTQPGDQESTISARVKKLEKRMTDTRKKIQDRMADKKNPDRVIVIGRTGTGKTTLIHGLAGDLKAIKKGRGFLLQPEKLLPDFVTNNTEVSSTKEPAGWEDKPHKVVFWDCPGFDDMGNDNSTGPEEDIMNAVAIKELFTKNSNTKVLLAIPDWYFGDTRKGEFQKLLNKVTEMFPDKAHLKKSLSVVVTQTGPGDVREDLKDINIDNLKSLTPASKDLLSSIIDDINTHVTSFPAPQAAGKYSMDKKSIYASLEAIKFTSNMKIEPQIGAEAKVLIDEFATKLNADIATYLKTDGAQRIINYCNNEIDNHAGFVKDVRTKIKGVNDVLKSLSTVTAANVEDFATKLNPFIKDLVGNVNPLEDMIKNLKVLKDIRSEVKYSLDEWRASLEATKKSLNALIKAPDSNVENGILYVKGSLIGSSDIQAAISTHSASPYADIRVFGTHTLFLDGDLTKQAANLSLVAPSWRVTGQGTPTINLSGRNNTPQAGTGATPGADGLAGNPGENGGSLYGIGNTFHQLNKLKINVSGGGGGQGGDGAKGAPGTAAPDGSEALFNEVAREVHVEFQDHTYKNNVPVSGHKITYLSGGDKGGKGGTGGRGGLGGNGGLAGGIFIQGAPTSYTAIQNPGGIGPKGNSGPGGDGGKGGDLWKGVKITQLNGSYGRKYQQGFGPWQHDVHVTENVSKPERWEMAAQKVSVGPQGDTGDQQANTLVGTGIQAMAAQVLAHMVHGALGGFTTQYKDTRIQDYKTYYQQQAANSLIAAFVKPFKGL